MFGKLARRLRRMFGLSEPADDVGGVEPPAPAAEEADTEARDEDAVIDEGCGECGGPWKIRARTEVGDGLVALELECGVCGASTRVSARASGEGPTGDDDDGPRDHHYAFAHQAFPAWFFDNPLLALRLLSGRECRETLEDAWSQIGEQVVANGGQPLPPDGLRTELQTIRGRDVVWVFVPPPLRVPEAYCICLVPPRGGHDARYLVFERTQPDEKGGEPEAERAILCEWLEGRRRRPHHRHMDPRSERFDSLIEAVFDREDELSARGQDQDTLPVWDLAAGEDPLEFEWEGEDVALHHCFFAFHLLPEALLSERRLRLPADAAGRAGFLAELDDLWRASFAIAQRLGNPARKPGDLEATVFDAGSSSVLLLRLPQPLAAPEPYCVIVPLGSEPERLYLIELSSARDEGAVLTSIDGSSMHSLLRHAPAGVPVDAVAKHVGARFAASERSTLAHLTSYARIASLFKQASADGAAGSEPESA